MDDSINGLHWVSAIAYCGTNCLAVTQANHCSEFRIPNCPITDDHKATFIELRIYSRELMVMFTLYYSFNLHRPEIYIPARLGLLFTLTEWWFRGDFCYWTKPISKVKRDSRARFKRCFPTSVSSPDWIPLGRKIQKHVLNSVAV